MIRGKKIGISRLPNLQAVQEQEIFKEYKKAFNDLTEQPSAQLDQLLKLILNQCTTYRNKFEKAWKQYLSANHIIKTVRTLPTTIDQSKEDGQQRVVIEKERYRNTKKATIEFIAVLEEGRFLLQLIREQLTGQQLSTMVTFVGSNGHVYRISEQKISNYLTPVLSTYGGNTLSNPVSLAYTINDMSGFMEVLQKEGSQIDVDGDDIYNQIWKVKYPYLRKYKQWNAATALKRRVFNSKDAEIYDLMMQKETLQPGSTANWLTVDQYAALRASMGGTGGATTQLQSGDVGLIQDKLLTSHQQSVNITRYSMINLKFQEIEQALKTENKEIIRKNFEKIFLINQERDVNEITAQSNKAATEFFNKIFAD